MARTVQDAKLATRSARAKLERSDKPHYRALDAGLHLGYRKGKTGGRWVVRRYIGSGKYEVETLPDVVADGPSSCMVFSRAEGPLPIIP